MTDSKTLNGKNLARDLAAGMVVFLVALPLCLGVALASQAPLFSGIVSGIIGGILVGVISRSHTSVSGPSASSPALVAAQIAMLGTFESFQLAVVIAGLLQIFLGVVRIGFLSAFVPSCVIKGLLAAIGVILILKQIPHVLGHDADPEGDMSFDQPDHQNTFSELGALLGDYHWGAAAIGLLSFLLLIFWDKIPSVKRAKIPAPLAVVFLGIALSELLRPWGAKWSIGPTHLVQVPVPTQFSELLDYLRWPDFTQWLNPRIYMGAMTIAAIASLETLLNLEAVDKIDPEQRISPPNRELIAQGIGNMTAGMLGGIPVTSVIVRSSVNIDAGVHSKLGTIVHGLLLLFSVIFLPRYLNLIPLSCLAAILLATGIKLANPLLFRQMWNDGWNQFLPFAVTLVAIVLTDLLMGILIGLGVSIAFILHSSFRRPLRRIVEKHLGGEVLHIELANQVGFFHRAALDEALNQIPRGGHVLLDAGNTDYIDPDVLGLIRDFKEQTAPARGVEVSLKGFRKKYHLKDHIQYVDYSTHDLQSKLSPAQVLQILRDGHERFRDGTPLTRDLGRQVKATSSGQHPLAVVLSCIDSRTPAELIFDLGVGDIFSVRVAGNIISRKILGSIEYACAVAGAKLILVMGHTRCGAVTAAFNLARSKGSIFQQTGCEHLEYVLKDIQQSIPKGGMPDESRLSPEELEGEVNLVARRNVLNTVKEMTASSETLAKLVREGRIAVVGGLYDVVTGEIEFLGEQAESLLNGNPEAT
ncbi:MAG: SulP family inorganic anion transporter [Planctomycetales bacterium]